MWILLLAGLIMLGSNAYAQPNQQIEMIKPEIQAAFEIRQQDIHFEGKDYRLFIGLPKGEQPPASLPVLYLLDGNAQFPIAMNLLNSGKKRPLVVGIGYISDQAYDIEQRTRDYTYPHQAQEFKKGGQANDFLRFIQSEVKPVIEQSYPIQPAEQHFFGHSFGGLFGLYVLFNQPELFNTYTIASPSLWWGNASILQASKPWITKPPRKINIVLGEYEESPQNDPNITQDRLDKIKERQKVYPTRKLAQELEQQGYATDFILIPQKDHGGVISEAIKVAVETIQAENKKDLN